MRRILCVLVLALCASSGSSDEKSSGITIDKEKKAVIVDCKIAPRKLADPKFKGEIYPIEVIACWAYPKGQKAHETVVTFDVKPSEVHKALESLGLKPGKPVFGDVKEQSTGPEVRVFLEVPGESGTRKVPIEQVLVDTRFNKPMPKVKWRFTGSAMKKPDPEKDEQAYGADLTGTLIAIFPVTNDTVLQTSLSMKEEKFLKMETNTKILPKEGTPVKLIIEAAK
jgi:hypothetical protein